MDPFNRIIDNLSEIIEKDQEGTMFDVLNYYAELLIKNKRNNIKNSFKLDIGTGFLFFSGFEVTFTLLKQLYEEDILKIVKDPNWPSNAPIRIIMGKKTSKTTKEILLSIITNGLCSYSSDSIEFLKILLSKNLIKIKVYYKKNFHVKYYGFYLEGNVPDDIWAGSSNFSREGLIGNLELCIPMNTNSKTRSLFRKWFDSLWSGSTEDLSVLEIIHNVQKSDYIYLHPRIFFSYLIKILNKHYLLRIEEIEQMDILLDFQYLSYYIIMERLQKYGGYILANSVGLGKSYVACQIIKTYVNYVKPFSRALIIVPARILSEWRNYIEKFEIEDSIDLFSMGLLQKVPINKVQNEISFFDHRDFYNKYSIIIVDEIHHYRNDSNRRENLNNILRSNVNAKILFLSATPINLGVEDLFKIIDLFFYGDNIKKFEATNLKNIYLDINEQLKKKEQFAMTKDVLNKIKIIENELTLKLSWRIVQDHFKNDLKKLNGLETQYEEPDVELCTYSYPDKFKTNIFDEIIPFLNKLNYEPAKLWEGNEYKDDKNLTFWYKWQLYKRLESSLYAFYKSINNLKDRFSLYLEVIKVGAIPDEKSINNYPDNLKNTYILLSNKERLSSILSNYSHLDPSIKQEIIHNIEEDIMNITKLIEKFNKIIDFSIHPFLEDKKFQLLENILEENVKNNKPTLIFSEFKDTIEYLYNSLSKRFLKIKMIHGGLHISKDLLISEFEKGKIDIILTTDILSEGINLPRADCVINFDLPYNPVLLLQRSGRALRITNPKKIYIKNFKPETEIDKELELYSKLDLRLKTILDIIGLDFIVWLMNETDIDKILEEEKEKYLKNYEEYRQRIAKIDPNKLISSSIPKESQIDINLRKAIAKYQINPDLIDEININHHKPFYTVLDEDNLEYFILIQDNQNIYTINELKDSFETTKNIEKRRINEKDIENINKFIDEKKNKINIESVNLNPQKNESRNLINDIKDIRTKLTNNSTKQVLNNLIQKIQLNIFLPEDFLKIKNIINSIKNIPDIFTESIDNILIKKDYWKEILQYSSENRMVNDFKLLCFVKYTEEESL